MYSVLVYLISTGRSKSNPVRNSQVEKIIVRVLVVPNVAVSLSCQEQHAAENHQLRPADPSATPYLFPAFQKGMRVPEL